MIIKINRRKNPFAQIDKGILQDRRLSYKARGIIGYLFSHEAGWQVRVKDLVEGSEKDGIKAIRSAMQELKKAGYSRLVPSFDENKQLTGKLWEVSEVPIYGKGTDITILATSPKSDGRETPTITNKDISIYSPVINFLNEQTGSKFRASSKKTQSLINARTREGATIEDFQKVITHMAAKWRNDAKMSQYLRPETLFGTKFEGYLESARRAGEKHESRHKDIGLPVEVEERYREYIAHVSEKYPNVTGSIAYLSKGQFATLKERKYLPRLAHIGQDTERRAFTRAHARWENGEPEATRFPGVWEYFLHTMSGIIESALNI